MLLAKVTGLDTHKLLLHETFNVAANNTENKQTYLRLACSDQEAMHSLTMPSSAVYK